MKALLRACETSGFAESSIPWQPEIWELITLDQTNSNSVARYVCLHRLFKEIDAFRLVKV
jgi:hypothetical protein